MARNRNRQPGPILRTRPVSRNPADRPATNLLARTHTDIAPSLPVRRSTAGSMAAAQQSDWGLSMHLHPLSTAMTTAWSRTKSS